MPASVIPIIQGAAKRVKTADRDQLVDIYDQYSKMSTELVRRLIIEHDRIDLLATHVLGYEAKPCHLLMLQWQLRHRDNLILAFRGSGKTTICTVTKAIHLLIKDRNLRILLASKSKTNSEAFLKEIKAHLEGNQRLIDTFGPFYDAHKVPKWDNSEVEVVGRTKPWKEASITCVGVESAVVSKHYDVAISDDIVDEDNSRTKHMRDKIRVWNYQTLDPTIEPPDPDVPHRGEHHRLGTRYHFDDLYGHLIANELKDRTLVIQALDERNRSPWPEKYPPAWFLGKKQRSGTIIYNAQYLCDTEAMKGEIFQYDHCQQIEEDDYPDNLKIFMGTDLAIKESEKADQFAVVVIGCTGKVSCGKDPEAVYVLDYYANHLRFGQQTKQILRLYDEWEPLSCAIEAVGYQLAQYQQLKDIRPTGRFYPQQVTKDKVSRAWKLSALFEAKRVFFRKGLHGPLIDQLILFPNHRHKDLFDAFDLAVCAARRRKRRSRREGRQEPGLI